jgi:hypothetical protein
MERVLRRLLLKTAVLRDSRALLVLAGLLLFIWPLIASLLVDSQPSTVEPGGDTETRR